MPIKLTKDGNNEFILWSSRNQRKINALTLEQQRGEGN
jgi:hypothetical protein